MRCVALRLTHTLPVATRPGQALNHARNFGLRGALRERTGHWGVNAPLEVLPCPTRTPA
jgi:hypothetical protein